MARLPYDNNASVFFGLTLLAVALIPLYYYLAKRACSHLRGGKKDLEADLSQARSRAERQKLENLLRQERKDDNVLMTKTYKTLLIIAGVLTLCFIVLVFCAPASSALATYDPYGILGISSFATPEEIKRAYRKMSLLHHPDKGGDAEMFQQIAKAYNTLTDEVAYANWKEFNNPDGQRGNLEVSVGLPTWMQQGFGGYTLLLLYMGGFVFVIPALMFWYNKRNAAPVAKQGMPDSDYFMYGMMRVRADNIPGVIEILAGSDELRKVTKVLDEQEQAPAAQPKAASTFVPGQNADAAQPAFVTAATALANVELETKEVTKARNYNGVAGLQLDKHANGDAVGVRRAFYLILSQLFSDKLVPIVLASPKLQSVYEDVMIAVPRAIPAVIDAARKLELSICRDIVMQYRNKSKNKMEPVALYPMVRTLVHLQQCVSQGLSWKDSDLRQLFTEEQIRLMPANKRVRDLKEYLRRKPDARPPLENIHPVDREEIERVTALLPVLEVEAEVTVPGQEIISEGDEAILTISIAHTNLGAKLPSASDFDETAAKQLVPPAYVPRFPRRRREGWWIVVEDPAIALTPRAEARVMLEVIPVALEKAVETIQMRVSINRGVGRSRRLEVHVLSADYMGLDVDCTVNYKVSERSDAPPPQPQQQQQSAEDDEELDEEEEESMQGPPSIEKMFAGDVDPDSDLDKEEERAPSAAAPAESAREAPVPLRDEQGPSILAGGDGKRGKKKDKKDKKGKKEKKPSRRDDTAEDTGASTALKLDSDVSDTD